MRGGQPRLNVLRAADRTVASLLKQLHNHRFQVAHPAPTTLLLADTVAD